MNSQMNHKRKWSGVLHRDTMIYYVGSVIFAAGIGLLAIGTAVVMMWKINYRSDPEKILLSAIFMGGGAILILIGINLIMKQTQYGYHIVSASAFMSFLALIIFKLNYPHEWHYPLVSYVVALYVGGFLILLGNAFANVVMWLIHSTPESLTAEKEEMRLYTDEEIERDIEEATRKSIELAAGELKFKLGDETGKIKVGKAFHKTRGNTTRVKDDITEAKSLLKTITPKEKVKAGSAEIDAISMQLSHAMKNQPVQKGRFGVLKDDIEYKFEKLIGLVK